jgi:RNA polymerase sigma-70 factor (ECF subfamily)
MRDLTLSDIEQLRAQTRESDVVLEMDEEAFRAFYDRTARMLLGYLSRVTGDRQLADDLLQETNYRRARVKPIEVVAANESAIADGANAATTERSADLRRAMAKLRPRDRELLWLAYAQGSSHREIADSLGLKAGSIKLMLFRARRRLADLLRGHGYGH